MGELVYTTDTKKLYIGDGITVGGVNVLAQMAGNSVVYNAVTQQLDFNASGLSTSTITEGTNKYFTTQRAQDAVGTLISNGTQTGVTITYDSNAHSLSFNVTGVGTLTSVSGDTNPSLGGNLNLNSHNITGTGTINISGGITSNTTITGNAFSTGVLNVSQQVFTASSAGNPIEFVNNAQNMVEFVGSSSDGTIVNTPQVNIYSSRGTAASPLNSQANDSIGTINFGGYHNGYQQVVSIVSAYAPTANMSNSSPGSRIGFVTGDNNGGQNVASFDEHGIFSTPSLFAGDGTAATPSIAFTTDASQDTGFFHPGDGIVCVATNGTETVRIDNGGMRVNGFMKVKQVSGVLPSPPEAGMIVLDGTTFKGYNGSSWVNLN